MKDSKRIAQIEGETRDWLNMNRGWLDEVALRSGITKRTLYNFINRSNEITVEKLEDICRAIERIG